MEPIEEQLRTLIVDIVRNCQLAVAHDWELMNSPSASMTVAARPASQETYVAHAVRNGDCEDSRAGASSHELTNFVKPPGLDDGTVLPVPVTPDYGNDQGDSLASISEWGYGNPFDPCECSCHGNGGLSSTLGSMLPMRLGVCAYTDSWSQTLSARDVLLTTSMLDSRNSMIPSWNETAVLYSIGDRLET